MNHFQILKAKYCGSTGDCVADDTSIALSLQSIIILTSKSFTFCCHRHLHHVQWTVKS